MGLADTVSEIFTKVKVARALRAYASGKKDVEDVIALEDNRLILLDGIETYPFMTDAWGNLIAGLLDIHGPAVLSTHRQAYKRTGREHAQEIADVLPRDQLMKLIQLWADIGFVETVHSFEILSDDGERSVDPDNVLTALQEDDTGIRIRVGDTFSAKSVRDVGADVDYPVCILEPAYTAGALEVWIDRHITFEETKCEALGDDHCEWVFRFSDATDEDRA